MNEITINGTALAVKEYNGKRVVTLKDIDELHGRTEGTASRNFRQNRKHFIEGEDYFIIKLTADEIRRQFGAGKNAGQDLTLVTESGYLMIVKSLKDDLAWDVQRQLVNCYFRVREAQTTLQELSPLLQVLINLETTQKHQQQAIEDSTRRIDELERRLAPEAPAKKQKRDGGKKWSERETDYLRKAYALGQSDIEIAAELGRTEESVKSKRFRLRLLTSDRNMRFWTEHEDKRLKRLTARGLSTNEIAAILGRSCESVQGRKHRLRKANKI